MEIELVQPSSSLDHILLGNNHNLISLDVPFKKGYILRYIFHITFKLMFSGIFLNNSDTLLILYCYVLCDMTFEILWLFHLALVILKFETKDLNLNYSLFDA